MCSRTRDFRPWLWLALLGLWLPGCSERDTPDSPAPLNVLLITLDTVRADHLGCYGHPGPTSPHLDRLAADAVRFDRAMAQASLTPVSHASILSGLLPPNHGLRVLYADSGYRLADDVPTLASVLAGRGYRTGAFLSAFPVSEFFGLDRGFEQFDNGLDHAPGEALSPQRDGNWGFEPRANQRRADVTTDRALEWLAGSGDPFFAWVHYWDPHDPWVLPPAEWIERFSPGPSATDAERRRGLYDAEIAFTDAQIGRLLFGLRRDGRFEKTAIVVISDHGEGLGDHGHWHHRILYQEQIRIPLIVRLPDGPRGVVVPEVVRSTDVYPTLLEAAGVELPGPVDGLDLRGLMERRAEAPRLAYGEALIAYDLNATRLLAARPQDDLLHSMTDRSWKLIYRPRRPEKSELYHLDSDPTEQFNRFESDPGEARRLLAAIEALDPFVDTPFGEGQDEEIRERLRSLGYVGEVLDRSADDGEGDDPAL